MLTPHRILRNAIADPDEILVACVDEHGVLVNRTIRDASLAASLRAESEQPVEAKSDAKAPAFSAAEQAVVSAVVAAESARLQIEADAAAALEAESVNVE